MSAATQEAIQLMDLLPSSDQVLALELIRKMVKAWDPDFTRLTAKEQTDLEQARSDNAYISHEDVDWS